ncbi:MAG: T9SS type A sorting domain-containing protein [Ignavibacteria bacterium]|nr:T9SS type A sorting domain-containing protein [Ignavibacteria bacterium]
MRKILIFFLLLFVANLGISQSLLKKNLDAKFFNDASPKSVVFSPNSYVPLPHSVSDAPPTGTVPFKNNYVDYITNGNSLNQVWVNGQFILVAINYCDSSEATSAATGSTARMLYNYSTDGGVTWADNLGFELGNGAKTRFPDMQVITLSGVQTALGLGRMYPPGTSSARFSGVAQDVFLGGAGATITGVPGPETGLGYFGDLRQDGKCGGIYQSADTLYYATYDPVTKVFSGKIFLYRTENTNTVGSHMVQASKVANHMTAIWNFVNPNAPSTNRAQMYSISTNNGTSWSAPVEVMANSFIAGDSANPYWHEDIAYKPGTSTPYVVFSTRDIFTTNVSATQSRTAYKICMYSPGSAPVVVADWRNVPVLADTNKFLRVNKLQVNANIVGHPSIGFSSNGNSIFVAFSAAQVDTNTVGSVPGFNYNDIYVTRSTNNGTTWSTPKNITNTPLVDEMYPTLERFNNGPDDVWIGYNSDDIPGSFTFNDNQTVSRTYQVLRHVLNVGVGVENISTTVPESFSLKQNFPNPFNPTTNIRFDIVKGANVTLKVFDVSGKEVATLVNNEFVTPGTKQVVFDAAKLSSGIYFYTLSAGDFKETKKMMLVK